MKLIFYSLHDDIINMIRKAEANNRKIKAIELTQREFDELRKGTFFPTSPGQTNTFFGYKIEIKGE